MKFIADVNVEKPVIDYLIEKGYDVKWVPDYDCQISDNDLFDLAKKEKRVIITNDKDFGELAFLQRKVPAGIILFRIKGQPTQEKVRLMDLLLRKYREKLQNYYVVVSRSKIRFVTLGEIR